MRLAHYRYDITSLIDLPSIYHAVRAAYLIASALDLVAELRHVEQGQEIVERAAGSVAAASELGRPQQRLGHHKRRQRALPPDDLRRSVAVWHGSIVATRPRPAALPDATAAAGRAVACGVFLPGVPRRHRQETRQLPQMRRSPFGRNDHRGYLPAAAVLEVQAQPRW